MEIHFRTEFTEPSSLHFQIVCLTIERSPIKQKGTQTKEESVWMGFGFGMGQSSTSFKNRLRVYYYNLKANTSQRVLMDESPIKGTSIKDFSDDPLGNIP